MFWILFRGVVRSALHYPMQCVFVIESLSPETFPGTGQAISFSVLASLWTFRGSPGSCSSVRLRRNPTWVPPAYLTAWGTRTGSPIEALKWRLLSSPLSVSSVSVRWCWKAESNKRNQRYTLSWKHLLRTRLGRVSMIRMYLFVCSLLLRTYRPNFVILGRVTTTSEIVRGQPRQSGRICPECFVRVIALHRGLTSFRISNEPLRIWSSARRNFHSCLDCVSEPGFYQYPDARCTAGPNGNCYVNFPYHWHFRI